MVKPVIPNYPDALTVKYWNKAKGILARIKKVETGITKQLVDAQTAFSKAPWAKMNTDNFTGGSSADQSVKKCDVVIRQYLSQFQPEFKSLEKRYDELSAFLKQKASDFEADPSTKGFSKAVSVMADAAHKFTYAVAWGTVSSPAQKDLEQWKKNIAETEKMWQVSRANISKLITQAEKGLKSAKTNVSTVAKYTEFWSQNLRGIGAQIKMASVGDPSLTPAFSGVLKEVAAPWGQGGLPKKDEEVKAQLKKDETYIKKFRDVATSLNL